MLKLMVFSYLVNHLKISENNVSADGGVVRCVPYDKDKSITTKSGNKQWVLLSAKIMWILRKYNV